MMKDLNLIPEKTAFVVIDLQKGIVGRELKPHSATEVINNTMQIAKKFSEKGMFVAFVRVCETPNPKTDAENTKMSFPEDWDKYIEEIDQIENKFLITKRQWGAFYGTELDLLLRRRGIETIVLCGISTNIGVDTTAREGYQLAYNQVFVEDAMSAMTKEEHDYTCKYIFPRIGKIRTTKEILSSLEKK